MADDAQSDIRRAFAVCRGEIQHEYGVLAGRLTSHLTSQAFLISGFTISMNNNDPHWGRDYRLAFPVMLATLGVLMSIRAYPGIQGVCQIIERWHVHQHKLLDMGGEALEDWAVLRQPTVATVNERNLWFAKTAAWIFMIAWSILGGIAIWTYTRSPIGT